MKKQLHPHTSLEKSTDTSSWIFRIPNITEDTSTENWRLKEDSFTEKPSKMLQRALCLIQIILLLTKEVTGSGRQEERIKAPQRLWLQTATKMKNRQILTLLDTIWQPAAHLCRWPPWEQSINSSVTQFILLRPQASVNQMNTEVSLCCLIMGLWEELTVCLILY